MRNINIIKQRNLRLNKLKKISILIFYAIFAFYFLVNGEGLFAEWDENWTWTTIIYLIGVTLFLGIQEELPKELETPFVDTAIGFMGSFIFTTFVFWVLYDAGIMFTNIQPLPISLIVPTLLFQLVIVVSSEELIFRGIILRYFYQYNLYIAIFVSAFLFSLFHLAVYQGDLGSLGFAFVLGILFAVVTIRWNIGIAIGLHFAWNAMVLGATLLA